MRRSFDFLAALIGLMVLSPMFVLIAAAIKLSDGGPVFYKAQRVGLLRRPFTLLKFRTMIVGAEHLGAGITTAADKRITPVGRFLRHYKLDEYPQLVNVLRRDMNLVGPRPEDPWFTKHYSDAQRKIFAFRPGITSPASLHFRDEASLLVGSDWMEVYANTIIPQKLDMDLKFFESNTFWSDLKILFQTVANVYRAPRRK
jgi:lipopolysaccharide/colanic/teichoic acid biosynthesis glycosyltransferase